MHIAVSWDITDGPDRTDISNQMIEVLRPYSWARPLTTYYVVKTDAFGREAINANLTRIGQNYPQRVRFVVTPLMQGPYQGFLTQQDWQAVNERTA
ncbi:hypothetical protein [Sinorhizobium meliloti]|uniref:hypothetical protein n=1 Tax=Rhizobium meliloti TaxID=382 RepID=UPI003F15271B